MIEFNPYDPKLHEDPYPVYRELRDRYPVHHNPQLRFWTLSRHDDVLAALEKPEVFSSASAITVGPSPQQMMDRLPMMIIMDPPRHDELRAIVNRAFTPRRIREIESRVRGIATRLVDAFVEERSCDLVWQFSAPLPTTVIAELLGVPAEDQEFFKRKSTAMVSSVGAQAGTPDLSPALELAGYLARVFEERRREPRDDLMSALLAAEVDGERLSQEELLGFAFLLLVAGNETTTNLISNALVLLDRHRDQRALLVEDPSRIAVAVEEFLRYDSPVQGLARTLRQEVSFHGQPIPEGEQVLLLFASANRDERRIEDPERFDVTRHPNRHLAFGFGTHFCLGASLARLEARVAFEEVLRRIPDYEVEMDGIERLHSGPIRGLLRLPARWR